MKTGTPHQNRNKLPPSRTFWTRNNQWKWMMPRKSDRIRCLTWKPQMCWGQIQDQALLSQPPKTKSSTLPVDSPGLQGMEDQPADLWPAPPAEGSRDIPPKDRCPEEDHVTHRLRMKTKVSLKIDQFNFHVISSKF